MKDGEFEPGSYEEYRSLVRTQEERDRAAFSEMVAGDFATLVKDASLKVILAGLPILAEELVRMSVRVGPGPIPAEGWTWIHMVVDVPGLVRLEESRFVPPEEPPARAGRDIGLKFVATVHEWAARTRARWLR